MGELLVGLALIVVVLLAVEAGRTAGLRRGLEQARRLQDVIDRYEARRRQQGGTHESQT